MGVRFLRAERGRRVRLLRPIGPEDVVIMPAFGVTMDDFERLRAIGCVLVDTTCGSVLNVWKRVESYARDGYTADHPRQALPRGDQGDRQPGHEVSGRPLPRGAQHGRGADRLRLHRARRRRARRSPSASPGRSRRASTSSATCQRVGIANQTTMLSGESLAIAGGGPRAAWRGATAPRRLARALPLVRHDLLGHAGAAGRGRGAARRSRST